MSCNLIVSFLSHQRDGVVWAFVTHIPHSKIHPMCYYLSILALAFLSCTLVHAENLHSETTL